MKWISLESTSELFSKLITEIQTGKFNENSGPPPLFNMNRSSFQSSMINSQLKTPSTPPKSSWDGLMLRKNLSFDGSTSSFNLTSVRTNSDVNISIKKK